MLRCAVRTHTHTSASSLHIHISFVTAKGHVEKHHARLFFFFFFLFGVPCELHTRRLGTRGFFFGWGGGGWSCVAGGITHQAPVSAEAANPVASMYVCMYGYLCMEREREVGLFACANSRLTVELECEFVLVFFLWGGEGKEGRRVLALVPLQRSQN